MSDNLSYLIPEQIGVLLAAIKPHRVGKDGKGFSHVEAYELRAHLNRIFGFARWSEDVLGQHCVFEDSEQRTSSKGKPYTAWTVCYRSLVRLTVCAPDGTVLATYTEGATGDATNQPSRADAHDLSLKTSASQAFKRCCVNLGDAFGLSLYRRGSLDPLVQVTLVDGQGGATGSYRGEDIQDAAPVTFRSPDPEPPDEAPSTPPPPPTHPPAEGEAPGLAADDYRDALLAATEKAEVRHLFLALERDGHGETEVGDSTGEATTLRDLAARRLKELK